MNHQLLIPRRRSAFSPLNFGSDLALWLDPSYGVYTDRSTQLTAASSQYWQITGLSAGGLHPGDTSWACAFWFYATDVTATRILVSSLSGTGFHCHTASSIVAVAMADGVDFISAASGAITNATWHFVVIRFDASSKKLGISLDGSAFTESLAITAGVSASTFTIGASAAGATPFDGRVDSCGFWNRLLTADEITSLRNSGAGKVYSDLTAAELVSLAAWYEFDGDGLDAHGANDLTALNAPTYTTGIASSLACDGDVVSLVVPRVGSNAIPGGYTTRPLYETAEKNGRAIIRFDGTNDYLQSTFALVQPWTLMIAAKLRTAGGASATWWDGVTPNGGRAYQPSAGYMTMYAGSSGPEIASDLSGSWNIFAATHNGASSTLRQNAGSNQTGDIGAGNPAGLTLAATGDGANNSAIDVAEAVVVDRVLTAAEETSLRNYFNSRYAIF